MRPQGSAHLWEPRAEPLSPSYIARQTRHRRAVAAGSQDAARQLFFEDRRLTERVLPPPKLGILDGEGRAPTDDWSRLPAPANRSVSKPLTVSCTRPSVDDPANSGIRREPELPSHEDIVPEVSRPPTEFVFPEEGDDGAAIRARVMGTIGPGLARQAAMDPRDGLEL
jgi:type IV secretion system protein VirD4